MQNPTGVLWTCTGNHGQPVGKGNHQALQQHLLSTTVLKPNGKWWLMIDYHRLNQQVTQLRWPMTQLGQELPKIKDAEYLSMDVASGFWTILVHVADQHKMAFTLASRQYTFTRCPFSYASSPAEFNIFLNNACLDATDRVARMMSWCEVSLWTLTWRKYIMYLGNLQLPVQNPAGSWSQRHC